MVFLLKPTQVSSYLLTGGKICFSKNKEMINISTFSQHFEI